MNCPSAAKMTSTNVSLSRSLSRTVTKVLWWLFHRRQNSCTSLTIFSRPTKTATSRLIKKKSYSGQTTFKNFSLQLLKQRQRKSKEKLKTTFLFFVRQKLARQETRGITAVSEERTPSCEARSKSPLEQHCTKCRTAQKARPSLAAA